MTGAGLWTRSDRKNHGALPGLLVFSIALCLAPGLRAGGSSAADFLRITPDSQSAALGNSGVANPDAGFAAAHNPALLSHGEDLLRLSAGQMEWLMGVKGAHYAAALNLPGRFAGTGWGLGLSFSQWSADAFTATDALGNPVGTADYRAQAVGLSLSRAMSENLHLGAGVKRISETFGEYAAQSEKTGASALAYDLGATFELPWDMRLGAALRNAGAAGLEQLPASASLGLQAFAHKFFWSAEGVYEKEDGFSIKGGASFSPFEVLSLRFGYDTLVSRPSYVGFTTGLGFRYKSFGIDYSFAPFAELGASQRLSMTWRLGGAGSSAPADDGRWNDIYHKWLTELSQ